MSQNTRTGAANKREYNEKSRARFDKYKRPVGFQKPLNRRGKFVLSQNWTPSPVVHGDSNNLSMNVSTILNVDDPLPLFTPDPRVLRNSKVSTVSTVSRSTVQVIAKPPDLAIIDAVINSTANTSYKDFELKRTTTAETAVNSTFTKDECGTTGVLNIHETVTKSNDTYTKSDDTMTKSHIACTKSSDTFLKCNDRLTKSNDTFTKGDAETFRIETSQTRCNGTFTARYEQVMHSNNVQDFQNETEILATSVTKTEEEDKDSTSINVFVDVTNTEVLTKPKQNSLPIPVVPLKKANVPEANIDKKIGLQKDSKHISTDDLNKNDGPEVELPSTIMEGPIAVTERNLLNESVEEPVFKPPTSIPPSERPSSKSKNSLRIRKKSSMGTPKRISVIYKVKQKRLLMSQNSYLDTSPDNDASAPDKDLSPPTPLAPNKRKSSIKSKKSFGNLTLLSKSASFNRTTRNSILEMSASHESSIQMVSFTAEPKAKTKSTKKNTIKSKVKKKMVEVGISSEKVPEKCELQNVPNQTETKSAPSVSVEKTIDDSANNVFCSVDTSASIEVPAADSEFEDPAMVKALKSSNSFGTSAVNSSSIGEAGHDGKNRKSSQIEKTAGTNLSKHTDTNLDNEVEISDKTAKLNSPLRHDVTLSKSIKKYSPSKRDNESSTDTEFPYKKRRTRNSIWSENTITKNESIAEPVTKADNTAETAHCEPNSETVSPDFQQEVEAVKKSNQVEAGSELTEEIAPFIIDMSDEAEFDTKTKDEAMITGNTLEKAKGRLVDKKELQTSKTTERKVIPEGKAAHDAVDKTTGSKDHFDGFQSMENIVSTSMLSPRVILVRQEYVQGKEPIVITNKKATSKSKKTVKACINSTTASNSDENVGYVSRESSENATESQAMTMQNLTVKDSRSHTEQETIPTNMDDLSAAEVNSADSTSVAVAIAEPSLSRKTLMKKNKKPLKKTLSNRRSRALTDETSPILISALEAKNAGIATSPSLRTAKRSIESSLTSSLADESSESTRTKDSSTVTSESASGSDKRSKNLESRKKVHERCSIALKNDTEEKNSLAIVKKPKSLKGKRTNSSISTSGAESDREVRSKIHSSSLSESETNVKKSTHKKSFTPTKIKNGTGVISREKKKLTLKTKKGSSSESSVDKNGRIRDKSVPVGEITGKRKFDKKAKKNVSRKRKGKKDECAESSTDELSMSNDKINTNEAVDKDSTSKTQKEIFDNLPHSLDSEGSNAAIRGKEADEICSSAMDVKVKGMRTKKSKQSTRKSNGVGLQAADNVDEQRDLIIPSSSLLSESSVKFSSPNEANTSQNEVNAAEDDSEKDTSFFESMQRLKTKKGRRPPIISDDSIEQTTNSSYTSRKRPSPSKSSSIKSKRRKSVTYCKNLIQSPKASGTPGRSILKAQSLDIMESPVHYFEVDDKTPTPEFVMPKRKIQKIIQPTDSSDSNLRRSERTRVLPLAWYKNERICYEKRKSGGFLISHVKEAMPEEIGCRPKKRKNKNKRLSMHTNLSESIMFADTEGEVRVVHPDSGKEVLIECTASTDQLVFSSPTGEPTSSTDTLIIAKPIQQPAFSMGTIVIKGLAQKQRQYLHKDTLIFHIVKGKLAVTIHETTSLLETGGMFFIPRGNWYSIKNLRRDEATLSFCQLKSANDDSQQQESSTSASN